MSPPTDTKSESDTRIADEVAALRKEIELLNSHRFVRIHNNLWRLWLMRFTSGLFTGLGTVIGATVLVSVVVLWLQQIEWVPVVGEWASEIARQIEAALEEMPAGRSGEGGEGDTVGE